jgi:hypothetical protein
MTTINCKNCGADLTESPTTYKRYEDEIFCDYNCAEQEGLAMAEMYAYNDYEGPDDPFDSNGGRPVHPGFYDVNDTYNYWDHSEEETMMCSYCKTEHNIYICMQEEDDRWWAQNGGVISFVVIFHHIRNIMRKFFDIILETCPNCQGLDSNCDRKNCEPF